jgi:pimeloyl-ACP methyl ester carboxylesterase
MLRVAIATVVLAVMGQIGGAQTPSPAAAATPVKDEAGWRQQRDKTLANMQLVMGNLPDRKSLVLLDIAVEKEENLPTVIRRKITFVSEKDNRVPAYLFIPKEHNGKLPAMVCLHQTVQIGKGEPAGLGGSDNLHYALELAERGYVTIAPDYPNFGEYAMDVYKMGYVSGSMKGIWNHMRAVDLLQAMPEVDPERIGVIGHSLGGHNSLFLAAFDERIKVAVSSCGFTSFPRYYNGDLTGWSSATYMPRIASAYHKDPRQMPFDFPDVLAAIAPRAIFINAPIRDANFDISGVWDCIRAVEPVYVASNVSGRLCSIHPDCAHDFPPISRHAAYEFVDSVLKAGKDERR